MSLNKIRKRKVFNVDTQSVDELDYTDLEVVQSLFPIRNVISDENVYKVSTTLASSIRVLLNSDEENLTILSEMLRKLALEKIESQEPSSLYKALSKLNKHNVTLKGN